MCSIGGFLSEKPLKGWIVRRLCRALLYYGAQRGRQSSGIWVNGQLLKRAQDPAAFIESEDFMTLVDAPADVALVHTRQPTCGATGHEQAHPFQVGNVISVHNGMITNTKELKKKFKLEKPSGVDSELVPSFISQHGVEALPQFLTVATGSSSIAVQVLGSGLYLMRDGGSLEYYTVQSEGNKMLFFASTQSILTMALRHVWLIPEYTATITLKNGTLFKASPVGVEQIGEPISYTYPRGGGHSHVPYSDPYRSDEEGYGDSRWRSPSHSAAHRSAGESRWPHAVPSAAAPKPLPLPAHTASTTSLPLHNNKRDAELQKQLGPLFELKIDGGRRLWIYRASAPEAATEKKEGGESSEKKLTRRERRQRAREQKAAAEAQGSSAAVGEGSGTRAAPVQQSGAPAKES